MIAIKRRVADYIADFLADNGITQVFSVTGGGAMHLNDGLGHHPGLRCVYNHHEQACAIAAEAYARLNNQIAAVCVTTGPGGTNAITGVLGGWLDSIPMLVISGQVRFDTTARSTGLHLRAMGDQEFDIVKAVGCMCKFSEMVIQPERIRYCLEKALYLATRGRPGPSWLDIPLNVQAAVVDTDTLVGFDPAECPDAVPAPVPEDAIQEVIRRISAAKRPVLYPGSGVRTAGAFDAFQAVVRKLNIPVVTGWNSIDLMTTDDPLYAGRGGIMGDRAGNYAVQNSDLVLAVGNRLSIRQVGYNYQTWAREAFVIAVDIDPEELKKPTLHIDLPLCGDAADFLQKLAAALPEEPLFHGKDWLSQCQSWKEKYPVVLPRHYAPCEQTNVYAFIHELSSRLPEGQVTVVGNGSACVVGSHGYVMKKGQRFLIKSAVASMGYDLPAAIGACVAGGKAPIVCVSGDGSLQMNLQELQTIIHHRLPIRLFIINNEGYHSIRQTQNNFFPPPLVGIGLDSFDLSFPSLEKLAWAYGYPYFAIRNNDDLASVLPQALAQEGPVVCEVLVTKAQVFEPRSAAKRLPDGTMVSPPLEDLYPFLPEDEQRANMLIAPIKKP